MKPVGLEGVVRGGRRRAGGERRRRQRRETQPNPHDPDGPSILRARLEPSSGDGFALTSESVEGASLSLQRIDDVHSRDGLSARMLGVGDCITDDVLEEDLEHSAGLLVDQTADALHAAAASQTADGGLGDALERRERGQRAERAERG